MKRDQGDRGQPGSHTLKQRRRDPVSRRHGIEELSCLWTKMRVKCVVLWNMSVFHGERSHLNRTRRRGIYLKDDLIDAAEHLDHPPVEPGPLWGLQMNAPQQEHVTWMLIMSDLPEEQAWPALRGVVRWVRFQNLSNATRLKRVISPRSLVTRAT